MPVRQMTHAPMAALSAAAIADPSATPTTPNCRTTTSRTISTEPVMARVRLMIT